MFARRAISARLIGFMSDQAPITSLAIRAPLESENTPPALSNYVSVSGATDALILEFFYTSQASRLRALRGEFGGVVEEGLDGEVVVRSEPVARVALPISAAVEMFLDAFRVAVEEAPDLKDRFVRAFEEVQEIIANSPLASQVQGPPSDDGGSQ